jgi:hypothetical protein
MVSKRPKSHKPETTYVRLSGALFLSYSHSRRRLSTCAFRACLHLARSPIAIPREPRQPHGPDYIIQLSPPMTAPPVTIPDPPRACSLHSPLRRSQPATHPSHSRRYSRSRSPEIVCTGSCGPSRSSSSQQVLVLFLKASSNRGARKGAHGSRSPVEASAQLSSCYM